MKHLQNLPAMAIGAMLGCYAATAGATVTYLFTADGVGENVAQQASALFQFSSPSVLTITLTDNVNPTEFIASELDGFQFTLTQAPASFTLQSVVAQSVINCANSTSPCPTTASGSSPYGWGTTLTGADLALGAGFTGSAFSYHPYAIVNQNYNAPGGNGGLSNSQHNPLLVGPVIFTFALTGLDFIPEVSSATFLFGTTPSAQTGTDPSTSVPEPRSLALVGAGLLALAWFARGRRSGTA